MLLETSSESGDSARQVRRRTRRLGPGLESDELDIGWDREPKSDELSSSRRPEAVGAINLSPIGTFTATPSFTSAMAAGGWFVLPSVLLDMHSIVVPSSIPGRERCPHTPAASSGHRFCELL